MTYLKITERLGWGDKTKTWTALDAVDAAEKIADAAKDGCAPFVESYTEEELRKVFGDGAPKEALDIARRHGSVFEVTRDRGASEWCAPGREPTLIELIESWGDGRKVEEVEYE